MKFQLPADIPPEHLWSVAIWPTTLAAVQALGYTFERERDDLDSYWYTEIDDEEIGKIFLMLRDNPPLKLGIDLYVQSDVFTADALAALCRRFGITNNDLSYISPHPHYPGPIGDLLDPPMTEADREREYYEKQAWFYRELEKQNAAKQQPARAAG